MYEIVFDGKEYVALDVDMEEIARHESSVELELHIREKGFSERLNDNVNYKNTFYKYNYSN